MQVTLVGKEGYIIFCCLQRPIAKYKFFDPAQCNKKAGNNYRLE